MQHPRLQRSGQRQVRVHSIAGTGGGVQGSGCRGRAHRRDRGKTTVGAGGRPQRGQGADHSGGRGQTIRSGHRGEGRRGGYCSTSVGGWADLQLCGQRVWQHSGRLTIRAHGGCSRLGSAWAS